MTTETINPHAYGPAYCVSSYETLAATQKIKQWIFDHEAKGCKVEFRIKGFKPSEFGVMWQVVSDPAHPFSEFSDCIDMTGHEFSMN